MTKEELLKVLAEQACEGRLAFFVGAGFSKAVMGRYDSGPLKGRDRALSWIDLLREVAKHFDVEDALPCNRCNQPLDCPQIASNLVKRLSEKSGKVKDESDAAIKDYVCQLTNWYPNKEHKERWIALFETIRPSVIITTNYDHVLEALLEDRAVSLSSTDPLPTSFDEDYLIYHMHGIRNRPDDIVLTREDYIEALRPFSYRQVRLTTLLRENSVLYLGYGKNDLNVLSAIDIAQQTFPDIRGQRLLSRHVQVEWDGVGDDNVEEMLTSDNAIKSYLIRVKETKEFLEELTSACKDYKSKIASQYEFLNQLKGFISKQDTSGNVKTLQQRHTDIYNVFENNVRLLNTPTKEGKALSKVFDDFIKKHYRDLFAQAHCPGNWEKYADMWSLLFAYFMMFSKQYTPKEGEAHLKPMPYTKRFGYALGWFNGLARWIGEQKKMSHPAWECFKNDWPQIPKDIQKIIVQSASRSGYAFILDLLTRAGFENEIKESH